MVYFLHPLKSCDVPKFSSHFYNAAVIIFMGRRYYRRRYYNRDKYSIEQTAGTIGPTGEGVTDANIVIVPSVLTQGMRKVKHITISMSGSYSGTAAAGSLYWAIVYVPQGTTPNTIQTNSTEMYNPNQFVMNCGVIDVDAGPIRISSPLSRNLNSGDSIVLLIKSTENSLYKYVARYAVTLQ